MKENDVDIAKEVLEIEEAVDNIEKNYRNQHLLRLNNDLCGIDSGIIYLDLLTNLERISDHSASIAMRVIKVNE